MEWKRITFISVSLLQLSMLLLKMLFWKGSEYMSLNSDKVSEQQEFILFPSTSHIFLFDFKEYLFGLKLFFYCVICGEFSFHRKINEENNHSWSPIWGLSALCMCTDMKPDKQHTYFL